MKKILDYVRKVNKYKMLVILIMFISILILQHNVMIVEGDDTVYKGVFNNISSFLNFNQEFFNEWGGRIVSHSILGIILKMDVNVFKILNAFVIIILVHTIKYIIRLFNNISEDNINKRENTINNYKLLFFIFALFLCIPTKTLSSGALWISGALNYLWPVTAMIIAIVPFVKIIVQKEIRLVHYLLYIPALILATNTEQTAMIIVCFSTIMLFIKRFKVNKSVLFYYILSLLLSFLFMSAPGNYVRLENSQILYMQDFSMYSIQDKIYQGIVFTLENMIINPNYVFLIICILIPISIFKLDKAKKHEKVISLFPIIYLISCKIMINDMITQFTENKISYVWTIKEVLYDFSYFNEYIITSFGQMTSIIIGVFIILLIGMLIFFIFKRNLKQATIFTLLYLSGIASSIVLGFSPTIFASGGRILFIQAVMNIVVCSAVFSNITVKNKNNIANYIWYGVIVSGVTMLIVYYLKDGIFF